MVEVDPGSRNRERGESITATKLDKRVDPEFVRGGLEESGLSAVVLQKNYLRVGSTKRQRLSARKDTSIARPTFHDPESEDSEPTSEESDADSAQKGRDRKFEDPFETFRNDGQRQRRLELEQKVRQHPNDHLAWQNLIKHEAEGSDTQPSGSVNSLQTYEKAIKLITERNGRKIITLGYLREGAKIWDFGTLMSKWQSTLKEFDDLGVWQEYFNLLETTPISFSLQRCLNAAVTCLDKCDPDMPETTCAHALYKILRATSLLRHAGFTEKAVAIWQALLEWTIPITIADVPKTLRHFEDFWVSEAARIGEESAKGWRATRSYQPPAKVNFLSTEQIHEHSSVLNWAKQEQHLSSNLRLPARILDDSPVDDPFRMVMYTDIQDIFTRSSKLVSNPFHMINSFLVFCQLPPLPDCDPVVHKWKTDPLIHDLGLNINNELPLYGVSSDAISFELDTMTLFAPSQSCFSPWPSKCTFKAIDLDWTGRILRQIAESDFSFDELVEYLIAVELQYLPSMVKKTAKAFIKRSPQKLCLYNAFALVQARLGNIGEAERVWSTAIEMSKTLPEEEQNVTALLWRSWVWTLLDHGLFDRAVEWFARDAWFSHGDDIDRLTQSSDPEGMFLEFRVRVHNFLYRVGDEYLDKNAIDMYIHCTDLRAIFNYLSPSPHTSTAIPTFYAHALDKLGSKFSSIPEQYVELLHQAQARLAHLSVTSQRTAVKPKELPGILNESLSRFPNNTIFMNLARIHALPLDRLRSILPSLSSQTPKIQPDTTSATPSHQNLQLINDIKTEFNRPTHAGRTTHTIRASFRRALDLAPPDPTRTTTTLLDGPSPPPNTLRNNPALWLTYLKWEVAQLTPRPLRSSNTVRPSPSDDLPPTHGDKRVQKALQTLRSLYLTSLSRCPFSKALHMLVFHEPILLRAVSGVPPRQSQGADRSGAGVGRGGEHPVLTSGRRDGDLDPRETEALREIYESMLERGLRIHVDFEFLSSG